MTSPASKARKQSDLSKVDEILTEAFRTLRAEVDLEDGSEADLALCVLESFYYVTLKTLEKCPSKFIRDAVMNLEIKALLDGLPVIEVNEAADMRVADEAAEEVAA
jgi:hypothetical protein